jgi:uncharacterized 2Fe-2S/4Fe-4S cluster protein (DUF4445 family)
VGKVTFRLEAGGETTIYAAPQENLLELARKANVAIDAPCSGNHSCGKCRVRLLSGEVCSELTAHSAELSDGWRLACATTVTGDAVVLVPDIASAYRSRMKVSDLSTPDEMATFTALRAAMEQAGLRKDGGILSFNVQVEEPSLGANLPDNERFLRAVREITGAARVRIPHLLQHLPVTLRQNEFCVRCITEEREGELHVLDVLPPTDTIPVCGLAFDIGTTTVAGLLVDMRTGRILAKASAGNAQIRYGADVINRIIEQQKPGGIERLQKAIVAETLLPMIELMCRDAGVPRQRIYRMTVASNTAMNHLMLGVDANSLRTEPYVPVFCEREPFDVTEFGIVLNPGARTFLAPNVGSYVGGDITAGTLASMIWNSPALSLFIDLGTNGEIVLGNSEFLVTCACSAGPAFEGGDISCGMRAMDGAIEACIIDADTMDPVFNVIGGGAPVGVCGSGIIDIVAELFEAGIIDKKGKFIRSGPRVQFDDLGTGRYILVFADGPGTREVAISEVDLDNFIRAKGAVFSGITSLLDSLGFTPFDVERVLVAGGIGGAINVRNAIRIGMFCDLPLSKYRYIGNSSLTGAYALLVSEKAAARLLELARSMTYMELSTQPGYMHAFVAACFLPHTDTQLFPSLLPGD